MSIYKGYTESQIEELQSNYLIDSWSYSKISSFSSNEKNFEMSYIYGCKYKSSASTVAGQAYHAALEHYFVNYNAEKRPGIIELEEVAYNHIDTFPANSWKLQKTTPSVEECISKAVETASKAIQNFLKEIEVYTSEIKEIIGIEMRLEEWVTVNGVDIPLPCHAVLDLVFRKFDGKIAILDHKSRAKFTDEKDLAFSSGKQAMTYVLAFEAFSGEKVDEVWFVENKIAKNRDKSAQLIPFIIEMDENNRRTYEALLYEPLKRLISAAGDPDYVYLINDNDNMNDKVEVYQHWMKTMTCEIEDFDVQENKKELVAKRHKKIRDSSITTINPSVIKQLKTFSEQFIPYDYSNKDMTNKEKIEHVLRRFGIVVNVEHEFEGFSSASYLVQVTAGVAIKSIYKHRLDIANALNVKNVRIHNELMVHENQSYVVIETGIQSKDTLLWDKSKRDGMKIPIGMDNFGNTIIWDLDNQSTPHTLIGGATGSGKSVCIISTVEYAIDAGIDDIYIFDPKFEFTDYSNKKSVRVFNDIEEIEEEMKNLVDIMQDRVKNKQSKKTLVVFDEFADAVANSRKGKQLDIRESVIDGYYANGNPKFKNMKTGQLKSLEENLKILLQKGRSSGFRILAATQRASTKVITGDAKVNFPVQICFKVPKEVDSTVMIDEAGAESLNGRGDGLIKSPEYNNIVRFQGFFKE